MDLVPTRIPTSIGTIRVSLEDVDDDQAHYGITVDCFVLDQTGKEMEPWGADFAIYVSQSQSTHMRNLLRSIRQSITEGLLGT